MRFHYLNEPVKYFADVPVDKRQNYTFTWYFDDKIAGYGHSIKHTWNDIGTHKITLHTLDNKTSLLGIKTTEVNIIPPTIKHELPITLYSFSDLGFSMYYLYRFVDLTYDPPGDSDVFKFHDTMQLILG